MGARGWLTVGPTVAVLGLLSFYVSGVVRDYFRPGALDTGPIVFGDLINRTVEPNAILVVTEYEEGSNSPILLYNASRRGWSLDGRSVTPHLLDHLRQRTDHLYFATTIWSELEGLRPDVVTYLERQQVVPLEGAPRDAQLISLQLTDGPSAAK